MSLKKTALMGLALAGLSSLAACGEPDPVDSAWNRIENRGHYRLDHETGRYTLYTLIKEDDCVLFYEQEFYGDDKLLQKHFRTTIDLGRTVPGSADVMEDGFIVITGKSGEEFPVEMLEGGDTNVQTMGLWGPIAEAGKDMTALADAVNLVIESCQPSPAAAGE